MAMLGMFSLERLDEACVRAWLPKSGYAMLTYFWSGLVWQGHETPKHGRTDTAGRISTPHIYTHTDCTYITAFFE
jgi:hypothetical protein